MWEEIDGHWSVAVDHWISSSFMHCVHQRYEPFGTCGYENSSRNLPLGQTLGFWGFHLEPPSLPPHSHPYPCQLQYNPEICHTESHGLVTASFMTYGTVYIIYKYSGYFTSEVALEINISL